MGCSEFRLAVFKPGSISGKPLCRFNKLFTIKQRLSETRGDAGTMAPILPLAQEPRLACGNAPSPLAVSRLVKV
jgi:hypothetical protein